MTATVEEKLKAVRSRISAACVRAGRDPAEVTLVAVSKYVADERVQAGLDCGLEILGENRVQELVRKYDLFAASVRWHLIGHLQRNKVCYLAGKTELIHSVDSLELARELDRLSAGQGRPWDILIQVNVAHEQAKFGVDPGDLPQLLDSVRELAGVRVRGLMTMAPLAAEPEETRPVFRGLRQLQQRMIDQRPWLDLGILSMGMSNDFEVAIEEGSTMVRIGSAIFGADS
jgi:pyridoxal phosphate enzyme (YggS family)